MIEIKPQKTMFIYFYPEEETLDELANKIRNVAASYMENGWELPKFQVWRVVPEDTVTRTEETNQTAKADSGKLDLTLVPRQIIWDIAEVRRYGNEKYHSPDNWKDVEVERYRAAAFRHLLAYLEDPQGKDAESGIEHYKHMACNMAFICEMENEKWKN